LFLLFTLVLSACATKHLHPAEKRSHPHPSQSGPATTGRFKDIPSAELRSLRRQGVGVKISRTTIWLEGPNPLCAVAESALPPVFTVPSFGEMKHYRVESGALCLYLILEIRCIGFTVEMVDLRLIGLFTPPFTELVAIGTRFRIALRVNWTQLIGRNGRP
jgi:hypothetical protein